MTRITFRNMVMISATCPLTVIFRKIPKTPCLVDVCEAYKENGPLSQWFARMTEDVVENFGAFVTSMRDESAEVDFTRYQAFTITPSEEDNTLCQARLNLTTPQNSNKNK